MSRAQMDSLRTPKETHVLRVPRWPGDWLKWPLSELFDPDRPVEEIVDERLDYWIKYFHRPDLDWKEIRYGPDYLTKMRLAIILALWKEAGTSWHPYDAREVASWARHPYERNQDRVTISKAITSMVNNMFPHLRRERDEFGRTTTIALTEQGEAIARVLRAREYAREQEGTDKTPTG